MTTLRDFSDFNAEPLVLPINGKHYTVPPVSAQDGIAMSILIEKVDALLNDKDPDPNLIAFDDEGEKDLYRRALGPLWDELVKDNVPLTALRLAGMVAFTDFAKGRDAATALWDSIVSGDAQGEAATPNRATRRAASRTRSGKAGAAANTTQTPNSGSGTRSRPKPSPSAPSETKD